MVTYVTGHCADVTRHGTFHVHVAGHCCDVAGIPTDADVAARCSQVPGTAGDLDVTGTGTGGPDRSLDGNVDDLILDDQFVVTDDDFVTVNRDA